MFQGLQSQGSDSLTLILMYVGQNKRIGHLANEDEFIPEKLHETDWWIDWSLFYVTFEHMSFTWCRLHCQWRAAAFWPLLGACVLWFRGIFIVPHLLWHRTSVLGVSAKGGGGLILVALKDKRGILSHILTLVPSDLNIRRSTREMSNNG